MSLEQALPVREAQSSAEALVPLAREALSETPLYVEHICSTMNNCAQELRAGRDQVGMTMFARGTTDLSNFVQLIDQLTQVAHAGTEKHLVAFQDALRHCVRQMECAMQAHDLVTLSDRIEDTLLPLLPTWSRAAGELQEGIDARAS